MTLAYGKTIRSCDGGARYMPKFLPVLNRMFDTVFYFPKPVVAAISGHAIAGGRVLACCGDRQLMEREAAKAVSWRLTGCAKGVARVFPGCICVG